MPGRHLHGQEGRERRHRRRRHRHRRRDQEGRATWSRPPTTPWPRSRPSPRSTPTRTKSGPLASDYLARQLASGITSTVARGVGGASLSSFGVRADPRRSADLRRGQVQDQDRGRPGLPSRRCSAPRRPTPRPTAARAASRPSRSATRPPTARTRSTSPRPPPRRPPRYDIPAVVRRRDATASRSTARRSATPRAAPTASPRSPRACATPRPTGGLSLSIITPTATGIDVVAGAYGSGQVLSLGAAAGATTLVRRRAWTSRARSTAWSAAARARA